MMERAECDGCYDNYPVDDLRAVPDDKQPAAPPYYGTGETLYLCPDCCERRGITEDR